MAFLLGGERHEAPRGSIPPPDSDERREAPRGNIVSSSDGKGSHYKGYNEIGKGKAKNANNRNNGIKNQPKEIN